MNSAFQSNPRPEREFQQNGALVERAYRGDKSALAELRRRGSPSAIRDWFKTFEAQQAKRDLMSKVEELRRLDELLGRSAAAVSRVRGRRV
ncbi:MAG: hypothetical protein AB7I59_06910 [Geminicoccaceae bacterium]